MPHPQAQKMSQKRGWKGRKSQRGKCRESLYYGPQGYYIYELMAAMVNLYPGLAQFK